MVEQDQYIILPPERMKIRILPKPFERKIQHQDPVAGCQICDAGRKHQPRYLFPVVDLANPEQEKILAVPSSAAMQIFKAMVDPPQPKTFWRRFWERLGIANLLEYFGWLKPIPKTTWDFEVSRRDNHGFPYLNFERIR